MFGSFESSERIGYMISQLCAYSCCIFLGFFLLNN